MTANPGLWPVNEKLMATRHRVASLRYVQRLPPRGGWYTRPTSIDYTILIQSRGYPWVPTAFVGTRDAKWMTFLSSVDPPKFRLIVALRDHTTLSSNTAFANEM